MPSIAPLTAAQALITAYSPWLVALSYAIAVFGSYISLHLAEMFVDGRSDPHKKRLHLLGAAVLGCTIWSMHFIGMLAYQTNMLVTYNPGITVVSMVIAIVSAYAAFGIVRKGSLDRVTLVPSAVLLGCGIAAMHYTGMAAMRMDAKLSYTPLYFVASVAIAIAASGAALWLFFNVHRLPENRRVAGRILAALTMGFAICGMHYMGMKAAIMQPFADCRFVQNQDFHMLALAVAVVTCLIFGTAVVLAIRERERRLAQNVEVTFPTSLISLGLGLTVLAVLWLGGSNFYNQRIISGETARNIEAGQISYDLIRLDILLARAARRNIRNHDRDWASIYNETHAELDRRLEAINARFPDETARYGASDNYLTMLRESRAEIDAIERNSFDLVASGRGAEAEQIFDGPAYMAAKDRYTLGTREFNDHALGSSRLSLMTVAYNMYLSVYPVLASLLILGSIWYFVVRALHTWRRETEEARKESDRASAAKSDFLANMSHEIRSPMNAIMGLSQILLKTNLTPEQQNFARIISKSGDNLLSIINDILDFSKINAGKLTLEQVPFDLFRMIVDVTDLFALAANEKKIGMMVSIDPNVPKFLVGDPVRVRQILTNFVSNAVKFTSEGHIVIHASVARRDDRTLDLTMDVHDTGIGIPADKVEYVFEKFSQAEESTTRSFGGTGLGLAISRSLAQLMRGRVRVRSVEGQGSTFSFTVPLGLYDASDMPARLRGVNLASRRALIIEPYEAARENLTAMLTGLGLENTAIPDIAAIDMRGYDFILLDSSASNAATIASLKAIAGREGEDPFIIITGNLAATSSTRLDTTGASGYLIKPFTPEQLQIALKLLLQARADGEEEDFFITRALLDSPSQPREPDADDASLRQYHGKRILVVDDMKVNQLIMRKVLEGYGVVIDYASNGAEALTAMRKTAYDLVFMDCQMPEMDGFEATRAIRDERSGDNLHPVIVALTADAMTGDREKCLAAGMNDYLNKPFKAEQIEDMVKAWLG